MSVDYTLDRADAADMLAEFGQAVTLTRNAAGTYDPATGTTPITTSTQAGKGVILPLGAMMRRAFMGGGDNIIEGDQEMFLSALTATGGVLAVPHINDTVTDSAGGVWTITTIDPLSPAGTAILYDCIVRRAA